MYVETIAYALIGLTVGFGALVLLPGYFPAARVLTVSTALVAALLGGLIARYAFDGEQPAAALAVSAVGSVLLVSVPARPDRGPRRGGGHRHRRQRAA
ncbi:hypothetical protein AB0D08_39365 [Kitasatospora sp. NPDC048540]|uniref:hypothetical protein n=1 Tax=Kitasatospora sp. NPDC048540 TaxID=3155634 RepID=UPI0033ED6D96